MIQKKLNIQEEATRCLLCENAPCTKACGHGDPARAVRAIRFDNAKNARKWVADCTDADLERAEQACIHYDRPIRIRELLQAADCEPDPNEPVPDLAITFCGIPCENPFFLASSAICTNYDMVARAFEMGWAGVFYKTICKEEIREVSPRFDAIKEGTRFAGFRNMEQLSENPYEVDFDILRRLKQNYPTKVVVASIMGAFEEEWIELAKMAEAAGCDAVELNFSCPQMRLSGMGSDVGQDPELVAYYTLYVKRSVSIPVIPKMTPNITHMNQPLLASFFTGADAVSAINTIKSVTISPEAKVGDKWTISGYSGRAVKPIALRFILEMAQNPLVNRQHNNSEMDIAQSLPASLNRLPKNENLEFSGIGGIETWRDALEFMQVGCRNVQVCTTVMQYGYRIIDDLISGMQTYMQERGIEHLEDIVGELVPSFVSASKLDRDTKVLPLFDHGKCIGCGRCYISCRDGGHQAITFDEETRQPHLVGTKCVGCHLCRLICPVEAIGMAKRMEKK
ncbi:MAG: tRNA-dihydrouridine synthase [Bacteroidales bacterium]|nr:tRNA-dihydrouridine synthase [Bacteroidales bacterium]